MRAETKRWVATVWWGLCLGALVGCYDVSNRPSVGGESHFLRPCQQQAQCEDLGAQFSCRDGFCRKDEGEQGGEGSVVAATSPLVLLVVDTSGSMERLGECTCVTPGCEECLPDCARADRNRWAETLEVLTGSFEDFACERIPRDSFPLDRYDAGYYLPYYRPFGVQRDDGLLDRYGDRVRFGVATFDGWDTWIGAKPLVAVDEFDFELSTHEQGLWSYNPAREIAGFAPDSEQPRGKFFYPNCTESYFMDTGIRSERAEAGGLQIAYDGRTARQVHGGIERSLLALRPYGGTPIAASLDDVYYLFTQDARMVAERERGAPLHVVLLTDGYPDDDYRTFGCDCAATAKTADDCGVGQDPAAMICPYPTPEEAARALTCGRNGGDCDGALATLHVVGFAVDDAAVIARLHSIARAGGAEQARIAPNALALQQALDEVLASIAD